MMVSQALKNLFTEINNPLVNKLLLAPTTDITALDLAENSQISFLPTKKAANGYAASTLNWTISGRQVAKVATLVKKLIPDPDENQVRDLVEQFKAFTDNKDYTISIVDGEDIVNVYNLQKTELSERVKPGTRLYNACFQGACRPESLEMFTKNVHLIKMIVSEYKGKVDGRSLLVYGKDIVNNVPYVLMDNIYFGSTQSVLLMEKKAKELEAIHPHNNVSHYMYYHPDGTSAQGMNFEAKLRPSGRLGYLDTLKWKDKTTLGAILQ